MICDAMDSICRYLASEMSLSAPCSCLIWFRSSYNMEVFTCEDSRKEHR